MKSLQPTVNELTLLLQRRFSKRVIMVLSVTRSLQCILTVILVFSHIVVFAQGIVAMPQISAGL